MAPCRFLAVSILVLAGGLLLGGCAAAPEPDYAQQLPPGADALIPLRADDAPPDLRGEWYARSRILPALDHSIAWTSKGSAREFFPIAGISHQRALASLQRFREVLVESPSSQDFVETIEREFTVYRSAGWDGRGGGVLFTGYCTPILKGSRERFGAYQYPLYALPPDLEKRPDGTILGRRVGSTLQPYPARRAIDGMQLLAGRDLELVWLADPIDAYLAHVNGSAVIELPDGQQLRLGYAGTNGRDYSSLRAELVTRGALDPTTAGLPAIRRWAHVTPEKDVIEALHGNDRYVFFTPIEDTPRGSLNVPVTPERTLATDKSLFPRGALVVVDTRLPGEAGGRERPFRQLMLDQDTGGAIRTAGRADIYLGVGPEAERLAGRTAHEGQLYYLFLDEVYVPAG